MENKDLLVRMLYFDKFLDIELFKKRFNRLGLHPDAITTNGITPLIFAYVTTRSPSPNDNKGLKFLCQKGANAHAKGVPNPHNEGNNYPRLSAIENAREKGKEGFVKILEFCETNENPTVMARVRATDKALAERGLPTDVTRNINELAVGNLKPPSGRGKRKTRRRTTRRRSSTRKV
jgi:hypothetical protein